MPDELSIIWPIEFVVIGVAVSFQASSRGKDAWKKLVSEACREQISPSVFRPTIPLSVVIYHFPDGKMGDIDNTVKPILDAMEGIAYHDDNVVERLTAQKFEP